MSDFYVLLDVSASVRPNDGERRYAESVNLLHEVVHSLTTMDEVLPQRVRVATIGNNGLDQVPLCNLIALTKRIFTTIDTTALSDSLSACIERLHHVPPTQYTNISGAIKYAAGALQGDRRELRGLIVVSDFVEDLPPGYDAAVPDLSGMCFLGYVQPTPEAARHPSTLDLRVAQWGDKVTNWHVKDQRIRYIASFNGDDAVQFFRDCGGRGHG